MRASTIRKDVVASLQVIDLGLLRDTGARPGPWQPELPEGFSIERLGKCLSATAQGGLRGSQDGGRRLSWIYRTSMGRCARRLDYLL